MSYPGHSLGEGGGLIPLQRCSQCILQPQLTGQSSCCIAIKKTQQRILYKNITLSTLFHKRVETSVSVRDGEMETVEIRVAILSSSCGILNTKGMSCQSKTAIRLDNEDNLPPVIYALVITDWPISCY